MCEVKRFTYLHSCPLSEGDHSSSEDEIDEYIITDFYHADNKRFFNRRSYRRLSKSWQEFLDPVSTNDDEFLEEFRMSRNSFYSLFQLIKDHPIFQNDDIKLRGRPQHDIQLQLLVTMHKLGLRATKFSTVARKFKISKGTARNSFNRVIQAILSLEKNCVEWPDAEERKRMSIKFQSKYGFRKCFGSIDGTLIGITERPEWFGEDFYSRKSSYSLQALVVNDINCRILYYHFGWPGSTHDNRAWRNCVLNKKSSFFFSPGEYLLADSAFTASQIIVPCYKAAPGKQLSQDKNLFNNYVAKPRVKSEHTIGILKNRFCCLKSLNIRIRNTRDIEYASLIFSACVVLHNLLLDDNKDLPIEWYLDLLKKVEDLDESPEHLEHMRRQPSSVPHLRREQVQDQLFKDYKLKL